MEKKMKRKKRISDQEMKQISIETLDFFSEFCKKHNLTYFLAYGTLIGAIRHKGFIPWDDDIDTWMLRPDYERLLELSSELEDTKYEMVAPELCPGYESSFMKFCRKDTVIVPSRFVNGYKFGLMIDVFPIDAVSELEDEEEAKKEYIAKRNKKKRILKPYSRYTARINMKSPKGRVKKAAYIVSNKILGPANKRVLDYARAFADNDVNDEKTRYLASMEVDFVYKKEWFMKTIDVDFEGKQYTAPYYYDDVLRRNYGDYMELPPESDRVSPHRLKAYYI